MQKICDICGEREATLCDRIVVNNHTIEYAYCEACYHTALKSGKTPHEEAQKCIARKGLECKKCGHSVEEFHTSFLFGCADCYVNMREIALDSAIRAQGISHNVNLSHCYQMRDRNIQSIVCDESDANDIQDDKMHLLKEAKDCTLSDLVKHNVISSRIRLARNVRGIEFPRYIKSTDERIVNLINGCYNAASGLFNARILPISSLTKEQKMAFVERHIMSLPLANNTRNGAIIVESDKRFGGISIMVNEEDHIREQSIVEGFDLVGAYKRLCRYDDALIQTMPIAYDEQFGFLTACPTNLGTGMRASVMLFLPALKRAGAIEDTLKTFKNEFGLTIRGVFGEGSDEAYDMYQISNSRTFGVSERETIEQVEQAVVRMCYCERIALEKLVKEQSTTLFDRISRSYGVLTSAYTLTAQELMSLIVDVKLGIILGILPIKNTKILDEMIWSCTSSSLQILSGGNSQAECDKMRAQIVRNILAEER